MIIKIRDRDVEITTGSHEDDEVIATFFTAALYYASRHAAELELPLTSQEYYEVASQFSGVAY